MGETAVQVIAHSNARDPAGLSAYQKIGLTSAALAPVLVAVRGHIVGVGWSGLLEPHRGIPKAVVASYYDLAFLTVAMVVALALTWLLRKRDSSGQGIAVAHLALCLVLLVAAIINVVAVDALRRPLTYQWLYYSDFLQSRAAGQAIMSLITPGAVGGLIVVAGSFLTLRYALIRWNHRLIRSGRCRWQPRLMTATVAVALLYFAGAGYYLKTRAMWRPGVLANPIVEFSRSMMPGALPAIYTLEPEVGPSDFLTVAERGRSDRSASNIPVDRRRSNVLVIILESAGAPYFDLYGGSYGIDRRLKDRREHMRIFNSIYAHAPATNKAMLSILCSTYPMISFETLTREHPTLAMGCLSDQLKPHGYRTGYFGSSDLRFQRAEEFLAARSFDVIEGLQERVCDRPIIAQSSEDWPHADISDDACTAASTAEWIEEDTDTPFFAVMWTAMSHFPYHAWTSEVIEEADDPFFNRYLNALEYADQVVDGLLIRLEEAGRADSTLVVIVGDHGEAFGHHGYSVHSSVHEETARVPFILLQPGRFNGEEDETVGGLIDLAPTVMDLLGFSAHDDWQGRSLFDGERSGRAYFFSPWSDYLFAYREESLKYILNASTGEYKMFNVVDDPDETHNLLRDNPGAEKEAEHRLAAWVQYQANLWERRLMRGGVGDAGDE